MKNILILRSWNILYSSTNIHLSIIRADDTGALAFRAIIYTVIVTVLKVFLIPKGTSDVIHGKITCKHRSKCAPYCGYAPIKSELTDNKSVKCAYFVFCRSISRSYPDSLLSIRPLQKSFFKFFLVLSMSVTKTVVFMKSTSARLFWRGAREQRYDIKEGKEQMNNFQNF